MAPAWLWPNPTAIRNDPEPTLNLCSGRAGACEPRASLPARARGTRGRLVVGLGARQLDGGAACARGRLSSCRRVRVGNVHRAEGSGEGLASRLARAADRDLRPGRARTCRGLVALGGYRAAARLRSEPPAAAEAR